MIALTGAAEQEALAGLVPDLALRRAREVGRDGVTVLVLQRGDDVCRDFRMVGRYGLLTYLDDHYVAPFEWVRFEVEGGRKVYEALLSPSGRYILVAPDEDWVHDGLRVVLDVEAEVPQLGGPPAPEKHPEGCPVLPPVPDCDRRGPGGANSSL